MARGHWRNWERVTCINTFCDFRDYKKNYKGKKCPKCGGQLIED